MTAHEPGTPVCGGPQPIHGGGISARWRRAGMRPTDGERRGSRLAAHPPFVLPFRSPGVRCRGNSSARNTSDSSYVSFPSAVSPSGCRTKQQRAGPLNTLYRPVPIPQPGWRRRSRPSPVLPRLLATSSAAVARCLGPFGRCGLRPRRRFCFPERPRLPASSATSRAPAATGGGLPCTPAETRAPRFVNEVPLSVCLHHFGILCPSQAQHLRPVPNFRLGQE